MSRNRGVCRVALLGLAAFSGCYEIPPVLAPNYVGSPAREGWPPYAVYDRDPFHPRNRWFHRQWSARTLDGRILQAHADEPWSLLASPTRVDVAELAAIIGALEAEPRRDLDAAPPRDRIAGAIYRSDLAAEASRVRAAWDPSTGGDEIASRLETLSAAGAALTVDDEREPALVPPPLRTGKWEPSALPLAAGLLPSALDPRSTRAMRRVEPAPASAIQRGVASELWVIEPAAGGARRVYRFDRAEWLQGREPWRLVPDDAEIAVRSPRDPSHILHGSARAICAGCHCGR